MRFLNENFRFVEKINSEYVGLHCVQAWQIVLAKIAEGSKMIAL